MGDKTRLYIDMDGTLAEWRSFKYELTSLEDVQNASNLIYQRLNEENYFYNLKPQENVVNAVRNIVQNHKDSIDVYILSASVSDVATNDKNRWLDRYLPDIDSDHRVFTKDGEDKRNFVTGGVRENDYLLDDRTLNLTQWVQTGKGIKLLNGQNHTTKTWKENMISCDTDPQLLAGKILSIINDNVRVQDTQPFHTEQTITIKPITVNAFENIEVWEDERKALQEQYLKIVRDTNFRALEWYTDLGGHYIFHPSVKSGDWQLSFIDNKGIPTSDSQYKDEDIGTGKRWIDPLAEFPHSRADKTITIKALFENPNRERANMEEDRILKETDFVVGQDPNTKDWFIYDNVSDKNIVHCDTSEEANEHIKFMVANNTFYKNQEAILDDNVLVKSQPKMLVPRYAILQLAEGREETHRKRYESLDYLNEGGERPNGNEYEMIYFKVNDPNETNVNLENVFQKFNADEPRPSDYYGHSLSVSDVVLVSDNGTDIKAYFCDRYGFNELDKDFITEKIQSRFETGMTIKEEHNLLATQENSNDLPRAMKERAKYINEEYSHIFSMADKRAVLEDTERLNTVFDYEMLYGGENNTDSITVFNEQLNRVLLQPTIFNENSAEVLQIMVDKKYFEALADKDLHNENLTYENLLSFQKGDIITLNSGHKVEIQEAQLINRKDEPFPTRYEAEYEINDSYYFDPEFPNVTPETSFTLAEVDYVERNGKFILEPPVIEQEATASPQNQNTYNPMLDGIFDVFDENTYKYYSTQRPIGMGTFPRDNNIEFENYDTRTYVEAIGREAWGELLYSQPLTENQLSDYELVADPSIKLNLSQRVSGDDLLNAQDLINDITSVGGTVDRYGNVTVYHRTDNKSVERIKGTGIMVAKEDGLFFSTKENGQNAGYGEAVIKLSIPVEKLVIDDVFSDEVHLRYPLKNTRRLNVSDYLVKDEPVREVTHGEEENLIGRIVTTNSYHAFGRDSVYQGEEYEVMEYYSAEDGYIYEGDIQSDLNHYRIASVSSVEEARAYNEDMDDLGIIVSEDDFKEFFTLKEVEMTEEEKEVLIQGVENAIDNGFEISDSDYQMYQTLIEERAKEKGENKGTFQDISFFVAEAMEFHNLGAMYENIPTIEEAIKVFKELPESSRNMGNGIGAMVNDWEYSLYENGTVDTLEYYEDSIKQNEVIKNAVKSLNSFVADERLKSFEDKGFVFSNKEAYSDSYKYHLSQNLQKYSESHYTDEATVYLAQASSKFIDVDNADINPTMNMEELRVAVNKKAGIIDLAELDTLDYVVLDTETTGFKNDDEIVELGITDKNGNVLYEGMFKATKELSEEASKVNGITMSDLTDKPSYGMEARKISEIIMDRPLVIYNKDFDTRLIMQSMEAHKEDISDYNELKGQLNEKFQTTTYCAMQSYTAYKDFYKSTKLVEALKEQGVDKVQSHRAVDDCIDTANLIKAVAEKERSEKLNEYETEANLSLADRYTQAMKMAGFELLEKDPDSQTTFTFKFENSDRTIGFDNWREVGRYLEDVIITDDYLAPSFEELIHPQGRIHFVTQNLDGEGMINGSDMNVYPDVKTALEAYLNADIVDGKAIGIRMDGQNPSLHAVNLAHFDTADMYNHIHSLAQTRLLVPSATVNELEQIESVRKVISDELLKNNVYMKLQTSFDDISMSARTAIARQNSEWGSWFGHIANSNRPQDYVNVDITGYSTHHEVAYTVEVIHENDVVDSKTLTVQTDENNLSDTMEKAYVTAHNEFSEFLKEAVTKLDTDFDYPMTTFSPFIENNMEQHYEQLTRAGYETTPSYETFRNTQKQNELASKIYNFYLNSDEAETNTMEQIKNELSSDNGKQYREDIYDYVQEHYFELSKEERDSGLEIITEIDNALESVARTEFEQSRGSLNETVKEIMQTLVDSDLERNNGIMSDDMREALTVQNFTLNADNQVIDNDSKSLDVKLDLLHFSQNGEERYYKITSPVPNLYDDTVEQLNNSSVSQFVSLQNYGEANGEQISEASFAELQQRGSMVSVSVNLDDRNVELYTSTVGEADRTDDNTHMSVTPIDEVLNKNTEEVPHREENSDITLHIKYQEPIKFNGFVTENDTITFSSREELDKFVNGEVAYDTLDNSVKKRDNEILQYADNAKGEIVWKAEEPKKEVNRKESKTMAEKTLNTGNEELSAKDQLMQQLADGIKNTLDSEHFADWCKKQGRLYYNNYSLRNAMLTYLQKPEASYVCGFEKWKEFGRQVKQGAKGIKVLAPSFVKEYGAKGSLLASIRKACNEQLKKDPTLEYATFRLGQSKLSFNMYKNGLYDVKVGNDVVMAHITSDEMRKFLDKSVIGKIPAYYNAITVFDVEDTTNEVEHLWVKDNYKKEELVLDDNGNPIKNKKGQFKILNSEERKARFTADIDMTIKEADTGKMEVLYDTLKTISNNKGIPFTEADPSLDETLASGALGYFRHPTAEHDKGNIVVSSELSVTNKVAVAFHEMAHSDLHADIDWLKDEMDLDAGEKVTRQMKETQAEAVAYMTASNFGIETEHKSFEYIANWSNGRELKDLEKSLDVIYKESRQLMKDIEKELDTRGFNLAIEVKDKTPILDDVKAPIVASYKEVVLNAMRDNETVQKTAFDDFKVVTDELQKGIVKEQIALSHKIDEQISKLNERVDAFEKSTDVQEQVTLRYQMKADVAKITSMQTQLNNLSEERVTAVLEHADEKKNDMKALYASDPVKAMEQLQKENEKMKDLTKNDLKYLATSKFISREYCKYLGSDNQKFVDLSLKQLDNLKDVMSKNKTVVEISFCEQWGDKPIFEEGTLVHPKVANKIIAQAEKQTEEFKKKAESENDYYPYSKCDVSIYSVTGKDKMTVLNTRVDIGDGEQKDLTDHLTQICSKGKESQALLENFTKSTRERGETLLLTPQIERDVKEARADERSANKTMSMSDWKSELNISSGKETKDKEENEKDNSEKERA